MNPSDGLPSHVAHTARRARAALVTGILVLVSAPSPAGIPAWTDLPQDMAVTGPSARSWALSLADPFVLDISGSGYALGEFMRDARTRADFRATLQASWGVRGRQDLLRTLDELRTGGMHAAYDDLLVRHRQHPVASGGWARARAWLSPSLAAHRLEVVTHEASGLGPAGVLAYDTSRYVNLARWGYQVGYLSGSEAWWLIMEAARRAQFRFDSWDAYSRSFLVGRDFWGGATPASRLQFERELHGLQTRPDGAWHIHSWRQDLTGTPIRAADPIQGDLVGARPEPPLEPVAEKVAAAADPGAVLWVAQAPAGLAARAATLLVAGRVDELDRLVQDARSGDGRDAAGSWRSSQIYAGIAAVFPDQPEHALWPALDRTIADWEAHRPASHAAALARAQYWISHAWCMRGEGYLVAPTADQQRAFGADLERATQALDAHERAHPAVALEEPHWAVLRIRLANLAGLDKPAIHRMGLQALRRHPDYEPIAAETALALNPVWGGTQADAQSFLGEAVDIARPGSGDRLRALVALHLARNAGTRQALLLAQGGFTWEAVKPSVDALIAQYPDPYNVNVARMLACISDIPARGQPYLQRARGRLQPVAWFDDPWYVGQCARQAAVALPDHAPWAEDAPPPAAQAPAGGKESRSGSLMITIAGMLATLLVFLRLRHPPRRVRADRSPLAP